MTILFLDYLLQYMLSGWYQGTMQKSTTSSVADIIMTKEVYSKFYC